MTDPDDDWGDLARELGVQKPTASAADISAPEEVEEPEAIHELHGATGEDQPELIESLSDEVVPNDDNEPDGEAEPDEGGDKQPGDGRKRRRRRRRRKKGDGDAADAGIADEPAPSYQAAGRTPVAVAAAEPAADDSVDEDGEVGGVVSPAEEDTAGEVLRELIATWNVPSWDEIISGLHR